MLTWLLILGIAFFLSVMAFSLAMAIRPSIVTITQWLVCPAGATMHIQTVKASYHRPGERGVVVILEQDGKTHSISGIAFLTLWLMFFAVFFILTAGIIMILWQGVLPFTR